MWPGHGSSVSFLASAGPLHASGLLLCPSLPCLCTACGRKVVSRPYLTRSRGQEGLKEATAEGNGVPACKSLKTVRTTSNFSIEEV